MNIFLNWLYPEKFNSEVKTFEAVRHHIVDTYSSLYHVRRSDALRE